MYTAFHQAHTNDTPVLHPLWFKYPKDYNTFSIDLQFFYGDSILVSPVTKEDSTLVDIYLAKGIFYDFLTLTPMEGAGSMVTLNDINFTTIPLHIKGALFFLFALNPHILLRCSERRILRLSSHLVRKTLHLGSCILMMES